MKFTKCHSRYPLKELRPGAQLTLSPDGSLVIRWEYSQGIKSRITNDAVRFSLPRNTVQSKVDDTR